MLIKNILIYWSPEFTIVLLNGQKDGSKKDLVLNIDAVKKVDKEMLVVDVEMFEMKSVSDY